MKITATAIDSFAHGATQYVAGDPVEVTKSTAEDLVKAGLVTVDAHEDIAPQTGVTDSQDDLLGGEKMEEAPQNKMAPAPANKGKK